jgi:hypothetical protein
MMTTRNSSNNVHELIHVVCTTGTPLACANLQPGGRCIVRPTDWKSCAHDTAGNDDASPSMRLSALMRTCGLRTSTPVPFANCVMNASPGPSPVDTRPSVVPAPIAKRSPVNLPPMSSCTV